MDVKNCPFCNGLPEAAKEHGVVILPEESYHVVHCQNCGARTGLFETLEDAIKSWNKRPLLKENITNDLNDIDADHEDEPCKYAVSVIRLTDETDESEFFRELYLDNESKIIGMSSFITNKNFHRKIKTLLFSEAKNI